MSMSVRPIICPRCHGYDPGVSRSELPDDARYCTPLSCDTWTFTHRLTKDGPKPIRPDGRADFAAAAGGAETDTGKEKDPRP